MPYGMYVAAAGAEAQNVRMQTLAHNMANVDTPGFKQQLAVLQSRASEAIEQGLDYAGSGSIHDLGGGVLAQETITNFAPGSVKMTGVKTDLAIDGDGFFLVQKNGERMLTRAGNFTVDSQGRLVTPGGYAALADGGSPITLDPTLPFDISDRGVVSQPGGVSASLALVQPRSHDDLSRAGENLFAAESTPAPLAADKRSVRSGMLEMSSVQPTAAMVEMIETARAYEANVRMIQSQDQVLGQLVSRVLRFA